MNSSTFFSPFLPVGGFGVGAPGRAAADDGLLPAEGERPRRAPMMRSAEMRIDSEGRPSIESTGSTEEAPLARRWSWTATGSDARLDPSQSSDRVRATRSCRVKGARRKWAMREGRQRCEKEVGDERRASKVREGCARVRAGRGSVMKAMDGREKGGGAGVPTCTRSRAARDGVLRSSAARVPPLELDGFVIDGPRAARPSHLVIVRDGGDMW